MYLCVKVLSVSKCVTIYRDKAIEDVMRLKSNLSVLLRGNAFGGRCKMTHPWENTVNPASKGDTIAETYWTFILQNCQGKKKVTFF